VYDGKYLFVCTKSYETGRIPLALEIARISLSCINDFVEQRIVAFGTGGERFGTDMWVPRRSNPA
jgi:hypothetical protein